MSHKLKGALQRAEKLAGIDPKPSRHNHNHDHKNINCVQDLEPKIYRISENPQTTPSVSHNHNHNHKVGDSPFPKGEKAGPPRKGGASLTRIVNSDPAFLQAMETWGLRGSCINFHCQRLGIHRTRKALLILLGWNQGFFKAMRNPAGYVATCLSNIEKTVEISALTVEKTVDYYNWERLHGGEG
ncbi:MAG: hypothetical protein QE263_04715 [Vampirovibrionales bacterium]|nr:hypothetical protein [Vampirovibrionales bacterium]